MLTAFAFSLSDAALKQVTSTSKVVVAECGCEFFVDVRSMSLCESSW